MTHLAIPAIKQKRILYLKHQIKDNYRRWFIRFKPLPDVELKSKGLEVSISHPKKTKKIRLS